MPADAITIRGLTKTFGPKVAVNNLDLSVPTGSLCGFIGPNGAGKTTTIRMIMSIIFPDSGELSVLGKSSAVESKDRIGYLPEERGVYRKMKVLPFLTYMARLKGVDGSAAGGKARFWLEKVGLKDVGKKKCEELSKGMQQKVQFIAAVIHEPDLLILDEVFSGLDPVNRRLMRELIEEQHRGGRTIVFSTHAMYEAEQLCDRVFMIHRGVKMLDDTLGGIRRKFDPKTIVVEPEGPLMELLGRIFRVEGILESSNGDLMAHLTPRGIALETKPTQRDVVAAEFRRLLHDLDAQVDTNTGVSDQIVIVPSDSSWDGVRRLVGTSGIENVRPASDGFHIRLQHDANQSAAFASFASALPVRRIELTRVNLEDVFIDLVQAAGETDIKRDDLRSTAPADQEPAHA